jgi:SAM-dependent methyltransferase
MTDLAFSYQGSELELFARAVTWKRYFCSILRPYLRRRVLEVGAGIGANLEYLLGPGVEEWVCLEPDADMADRIRRRDLPKNCRVVVGTIERVSAEEHFDTILYIDVLEHIEDDAGELREAARRLAIGGRLVVLAPAHQFLFTPFDRAIGHFRRYDRASLQGLTPRGCRVEDARMLDSVGFFASLANRHLLHSDMPTERQIWFWNRVLIPCSRILDPLTLFKFGKTTVVVWRRVC